MRPTKIAITGGPCSGKTTGFVRLQEHLEKLGKNVVVVPEAATIVFGGAGRPKDTSRKRLLEYQKAILQTQLSMEAHFEELFKNQPKTIILTDRGVPDGKAFVSAHEWQALLDDMGLEDYKLLNRYDAVIHLVTAADGVPEAYKLEGVRNETPDQAVAQDYALQQAYLGHGHLKIIDNSTDFAEKMRRTVAEICQFLGEPEPLEIERKFLVGKPPQLPKTCVSSIIEQTYLESPIGEEWRVRRRTKDGSAIYTFAKKQIIRPGVRIEKESAISGAEYLNLLENKDLNRLTIRKRRHCFIHNRRCYELDEYMGHLSGLWVMEAEVENLETLLTFPDWLTISAEVTGNPTYSNSELALRNSTSLEQMIAGVG